MSVSGVSVCYVWSMCFPVVLQCDIVSYHTLAAAVNDVVRLGRLKSRGRKRLKRERLKERREGGWVREAGGEGELLSVGRGLSLSPSSSSS